LDSAADDIRVGEVIASVAQLNPEVRFESGVATAECDQTLMVLAGSDRVIEAARQINHNAAYARIILARLGEPYLIAVLTSRPPCLACARAAILAPVERGSFAAATAMAAAAETIKCLLSTRPEPSRLIEFSGYESRSIRLETEKGCPECR
jgi:tRNA(Arg) A34 adenosine deaminase TadA